LATASCNRSRVHAVLATVTALVAACAQRSTPDLEPASAEFDRRAPDACRVRLDTSKGSIVLEMRREWAPHGVDRFYNLVRAGYYDDTAVFRVRAGVWAQFGIHGEPAVARRWRTSTIPDDPRVLSNTRGTVAFAFKDPDGRTTQVFINLRDNSAYDAEPFVPFARVVEGLQVADAFYAEYGERAGGGIRAGKQDPVFEGGNTYLRREFPDLDYIRRASIVSDSLPDRRSGEAPPFPQTTDRSPPMVFIMGAAVGLVLVFLAAMHLYWLAGGRRGIGAAVPEVDGEAAFEPGPGATIAVAALLLGAAGLVTLCAGLWTLPVPDWLPRIGTWTVAAVMAARAIGDFRLVGLFKRVRGTEFARRDSRLYTPLCAALAAGCAVVAAL
jgi:peptidyl-prolyl cis-trans isomerase A (cyclophilin A)